MTVTDTTNPMAAQIAASRQMIEGLIARANESATKIRSVQNANSAVSDLIKESDDATVVKFREERDKLLATLSSWENEVETYVKANLLPKDESVDVDTEKKSYDEAKAAAKALVGALKILGGDDSVKDLPEIMSVGRGGSSQAGVTGIKRPRVDRIRIKDARKPDAQYTEVKHVKKNDDGSEKVTVSFSVLANTLKAQFGEKVDANTLREHAESVAGEYDTWSNRNGEPFEFAISFGDEDKRQHVMVEVTPQN